MFEDLETGKQKSLLSHWRKLNLNQKLGLVGLVLSFGFGLFGILGFIWQTNFQTDVVCLSPQTQDASASAFIWVDVGGAVKKPGIYRLRYGARLADLINLAGGFSKQADKYYLNKQLNLAQRLTDEAKIYIPTKKELRLDNNPVIYNDFVGYRPTKLSLSWQQMADGKKNESFEQSPIELPVKPASRISINQASLAELMSLKGVGEVRAKKIIDNRPYTSLEELVTKKVLPQSTYQQNRDLLVL